MRDTDVSHRSDKPGTLSSMPDLASLGQVEQQQQGGRTVDMLELSLCYNVAEEKLTLGINKVELSQITSQFIREQGLVTRKFFLV